MTRSTGDARPSAMEVEYRVPGACWRPSYVLRVDPAGGEASLAVRAVVCQRSGEPWERVRLALSTADLQRSVSLPELASIRIGRRQPAEPALAWREPPSGADSLFEDLDEAMGRRPGRPRPTPSPSPPPAPRRSRRGGRMAKKKALRERAEMPAEMEAEKEAKASEGHFVEKKIYLKKANHKVGCDKVRAAPMRGSRPGR